MAEVRKAWLAPFLLVFLLIGLAIQLTVLNGLALPGGGTPDLVLVLVAALAVTQGPAAGAVIGFAAGFCLDVAPPGSLGLGQYTLALCLAGWAAGRLGKLAGTSALRALLSVAVVIIGGEAIAAAVGRLLNPAAVPLSAVRTVLPATIGYDLLLSPFVLVLTGLSTALLTAGLARGASLLPGHAQQRKRRVHEPRIATSHPKDGWVGNGLHAGQRHGAARGIPRRDIRLRLADGVAGSASGLARHPGAPVRPPADLRLSRSRRRDGTIGGPVGVGHGSHWRPSAHPGLLAGSRREIPIQRGPAGRSRPSAPIHFSGTGSSALRPGAAGYPRRSAPIRFSGTGSSAVRPSPGSAGRTATRTPRLRMGASRSAFVARRPAAIPRVDFRTHRQPVARQPAATPRFRRRTLLFRSRATSGLVAGGVLGASTVRPGASRPGTPRLRLGSRRLSPGMIGGTGLSPLRRPAVRGGKQPRFGYGRRSLLAFLTGRRIGGRWLARRRVGRRSGVWMLGRRTGGRR